jgi:hypothetical protein
MTAASSDSVPDAMKQLCQPYELTRNASPGGPTAVPSATPEMNMLLPVPRSDFGSQSESVLMAAGANGASPTPRSSRGPSIAATEPASVVRKLDTAQIRSAAE